MEEFAMKSITQRQLVLVAALILGLTIFWLIRSDEQRGQIVRSSQILTAIEEHHPAPE
jgi:hypothetical protein